jgi:hypothetical protein
MSLLSNLPVTPFYTGADLHHVKGGARLFGCCLFMVGLLASAFFISVFTESMLNQVDVLRSGKSRVVETGHTLVSSKDGRL